MQDIQQAVQQAKFSLQQLEHSPQHTAEQLSSALQSLSRCLEGENTGYALQFAYNEVRNALLAVHEPSRTKPLQYFFGQAMAACLALEQELRRQEQQKEHEEEK